MPLRSGRSIAIIIRQMFAPVTAALHQDALIGSGCTVLDIATGPGEPALTIASSVGPAGRVFGVDPVPEMVEAARREARHLGLRNAQFDVASQTTYHSRPIRSTPRSAALV